MKKKRRLNDMSLVFDLDGVVATGTVENIYSDKAGWAYEKCIPVQKVVDLIRRLYIEGFKIIFNTSRPIIDEEKTIFWLEKHSIPFDELRMEKPYGELYVDDKGFRFDPKIGTDENIDKLVKLIRELTKTFARNN